MTKSHKIVLSAVSVLAIAFVAVAGVLGWNFYYDHKCANFSSDADIYVYPNMDYADVLAEITEKCGVRNLKSLERVFRKELTSNQVRCKTGHYTIKTSNTSLYVARMLANGWQTPVNLVLSGSIRLRETLARKISNQMLMDSLTVIDALRDSALLAGYGFTPQNVFALIMPDTYQVYWTDSMKTILDKQKAAYDAFWTDENKAKAKVQGLSQMEVSTLASIVRGESNYVPEYPKIANVYLNRLHKGMKLQADPTIAFCYDYTLNRILKAHLKVDSPYNTYMHEGLPPGPICSPGKDAMSAVLNPKGGKELFFCASPDFNGQHLFAETYSEHKKNARAFQKALTERLRKDR